MHVGYCECCLHLNSFSFFPSLFKRDASAQFKSGFDVSTYRCHLGDVEGNSVHYLAIPFELGQWLSIPANLGLDGESHSIQMLGCIEQYGSTYLYHLGGSLHV